jgi:hypothetical protein
MAVSLKWYTVLMLIPFDVCPLKWIVQDKKGDPMSDTIDSENTNVVIPESNMERALQILQEFSGESVSHAGLNTTDRVMCLLEDYGFSVRKRMNNLCIDDYVYVGDFDVDEDDLFLALTEVIANGSYMTGFSNEGVYWQVRYLEGKRRSFYGNVVFPSREGFPSEIPTL